MDINQFTDGDRVKLLSVHHRSNPILKTKVGQHGTVLTVGHDGYIRVKFDQTDACYGEYWIKPNRLEKVDG